MRKRWRHNCKRPKMIRLSSVTSTERANLGFFRRVARRRHAFHLTQVRDEKRAGRVPAKRYSNDQCFPTPGRFRLTFASVEEGQWRTPLSPAAKTDLADFSAVMVEKFFKDLTEACRRVDPNHLNLGIRYYTVPPAGAGRDASLRRL